MTPEEERERRLVMLDDHIGQSLRESEAAGELRHAPSWGKPLDFADGYAQTPDELKLPMKMLKDAGIVPPEVELMREIAALAERLEGRPQDESARADRQRLAEMRQALALRLEKLAGSGSF